MSTLSRVDVGVDVSKKHLDFYLHGAEKAIHVPNSIAGIEQVAGLLSQYKVGQVVCESTGGYERLMCNTLRGVGYRVWRVTPNRIKAFIVSEGIKAKTDKIDAQMIAKFASQKQSAYEPVVASDNVEKLKSLVALKASMTAQAAELKTQLQQTVDAECAQYQTKHLQLLEKQIEKLAARIKELIDADADLKHKAKIVTSIPGIGDGTAAMSLALLPELGKISNKAAAALVGVAPYTKQSGCFKGQAKISGGRSSLRAIIYMAALTAIRYNQKLAVFYLRLIAAGKTFKVAIVAVMRKLVVYMNILVRRGELWNAAV